MKRYYQKIALWLVGTAAYFLAVAFVLAMLFDSAEIEIGNRSSLKEVAHSEVRQPLLAELAASPSVQGVLLPVGPDDHYLPGLPEVWDELVRASAFSSQRKDVSGFDGLQMVRDISSHGAGAVAELFMTGKAVGVIRVASLLLVLNDSGRIQVVDCAHPSAPELRDPLPYPPVEKMVVEGGKAFLLLKRSAQLNGAMVVLDLSATGETEELARLTFPGPVVNFFFLDGQLVTYESRGSLRHDQHLSVYSLSNDYELHLKKKIKSPLIHKPSVLVGRHLIAPDLRDGLNVVNLDGFQEPLPVVSLRLQGHVRRLAHFGDQLFAVGPNGQLYVVDLQNPQRPELVSQRAGTQYLTYYLSFGDYSYFFSDNGYLHVYDIPSTQIARLMEKSFVPLQGSLTHSPENKSFLFLNKHSHVAHDLEALPVDLARTSEIVAVEPWGEYNVLLDKNGNLSFLRLEKYGRLSLEKRVVLPPQNRWLAAGGKYLYAGGATLEVFGCNGSGEISHLGTSVVPGVKSTDGVVVNDSLFVAAGRQGVMQYSLVDPSQPESLGAVMLPSHLKALVDVRQLALHGKRLLAAAGPAGLLVIDPNSTGGFYEGGMMFESELVALTTINDFCLVSDRLSVHVIDLREWESLQKLGQIAFLGVERFVAADNDLWAGYVPGTGWTVLPAPKLVSSTELNKLIRINAFSDQEVARYRLSLFDDNSVVSIPGVLSMPALSVLERSGETHVAN